MEFQVNTNGFSDIIDITEKVQEKVKASKTKDGIALVFVLGSTAGIASIEYEEGAIEDFKEVFEKIAPSKGSYCHEKDWHDSNGFSHVRAGLLKPSLTLPVEDGKILLGKWQRIVLVDFDNKKRERTVMVKAVKTN